MAAVTTLTIAQAADELGVAPARVRSLVASGALPSLGSNLVEAEGVAELARRGTLRSIDVAAVESALDRALKRRLPLVLSAALAPVATEVATALADVEISTRQLTEAEHRASSAEEALARTRDELSASRAVVATLEDALAASRSELAVVRAELAVAQERPAGLFRRRRSSGSPAAA